MINSVIFDTNVILRYLVKDSPTQLLQAQKYVEEIEQGKLKGFISILVVNEAAWVLEKYYDLEKEEYIPLLLKLLALKNFKITEVKKEVVIRTLELMQKRNIDFTDVYLLCIKGDKEIFSFDEDLRKITKY